MLNKAQIDALEQLREKATPGLWGDNGGIYADGCREGLPSGLLH